MPGSWARSSECVHCRGRLHVDDVLTWSLDAGLTDGHSKRTEAVIVAILESDRKGPVQVQVVQRSPLRPSEIDGRHERAHEWSAATGVSPALLRVKARRVWYVRDRH